MNSRNEDNASAQYMLGSCYYFGEGVTQNNKTAVKWFFLSAEQGNAEAQEKLDEYDQ